MAHLWQTESLFKKFSLTNIPVPDHLPDLPYHFLLSLTSLTTWPPWEKSLIYLGGVNPGYAASYFRVYTSGNRDLRRCMGIHKNLKTRLPRLPKSRENFKAKSWSKLTISKSSYIWVKLNNILVSDGYLVHNIDAYKNIQFTLKNIYTTNCSKDNPFQETSNLSSGNFDINSLKFSGELGSDQHRYMNPKGREIHHFSDRSNNCI